MLSKIDSERSFKSKIVGELGKNVNPAGKILIGFKLVTLTYKKNLLSLSAMFLDTSNGLQASNLYLLLWNLVTFLLIKSI